MTVHAAAVVCKHLVIDESLHLLDWEALPSSDEDVGLEWWYANQAKEVRA